MLYMLSVFAVYCCNRKDLESPLGVAAISPFPLVPIQMVPVWSCVKE